MAHPPEVRDPDQEPQERRLASPSPPATDGAAAVELVGGVPAGRLAAAGLDDGGDGRLVAVGDRAAQRQQQARPRGGGQRRRSRRAGSGAVWSGWARVGCWGRHSSTWGGAPAMPSAT
jgi:hypothetical protein